MNVGRVVGCVLLALGIISIVLASYVANMVAIESGKAQAKIAKGESMFQGNPFSEMVGGAVVGSAKDQVASEVAKYNQIVLLMRVGGIFVAVVGAGMAVFCKGKNRK